MLYLPTIMSILEVLAVTIPVLLSVAFVTIAERKTMASMQRRLGPNSVGWWGLLQAFKGKQVRHLHTTRILQKNLKVTLAMITLQALYTLMLLRII